MNMKESVISVLSNWNNFSDRACRSEFWYFQLAYIIVAVIVSTIELKFVSNIPLSNILDVLLLIPLFAVTARRLHDYGLSGLHALLILACLSQSSSLAHLIHKKVLPIMEI